MQTVEAGSLSIGRNQPTRIMGVLNVSAESPYDPSVFTDPGEAAAYVDDALIGEGADIVDVGLATANKRFDILSADEEIDRLSIALDAIAAVDGEATFSIETRYAAVAEAAIDGGFDMINDVCGFADPKMPDVVREYGVPAVKMAGPGDLERPGALTNVDDIYDALARDPLPASTIIDPAFGGWCEEKTPAVDRETFRRLGEFRAIDRPMLVSINRKNFLRHLADRSTEEALPVSLAATAMAVDRGADIVRTHDVRETKDAARIGETFATNGALQDELGLRELDVRTRAELGRHLDRIGAPRTIVADGIPRVFALDGLDNVETALLQHLLAQSEGHLAVGDDGEAVVIVTERDVKRLASTVGDESGRLVDLFERMQAR